MQSVKYDLRTAVPQDIPALLRNWQISFGDADDYLDFFFRRRFVPDNTLVACANGEPVSQLFLLPAALRAQDELLNAYYLFAAATHPDHRKRGIMTMLLTKARSICADRGKDAIVLLPGTRELYRYYEKQGYEISFSRRRWTVSRDELRRLSVPINETVDAQGVIQSVLRGRDGLCWDADAIGYALDEHRLYRGTYASSEHAFVSVSDDEAVCLCAPQHFGECAALLLRLSGLPRFTLILPPDVPIGTVENGGMLCRIREEEIYLRDAFISFAME